MADMAQAQQWQRIPTDLNVQQFEKFVFPHLTVGRWGPSFKLSPYVIFNYILQPLHTG